MSTPTMKELALMASTALVAAVLLRVAAGCRWSAAKVRWLSAATGRLADRVEQR